MYYNACLQSLSPLMMQVLQVLKFNHRNGVLDFSGLFIYDFDEMGAVMLDELAKGKLINEYHGTESTA
jgi:hypothetical protein